MALFGNLGSMLKNIGGGALGAPTASGSTGFTTNPAGTAFKQTLVTGSFTGIASSDQTVTNAQYNTIGYKNIGAQQAGTLGWGNLQNDPANQGKVFIDIENTSGTDIDGWIRVQLANASETRVETLFEMRTERLSENPTDDTKWIHVPEYALKVTEDSKILLQFKPDGSAGSTQVVDKDETVIYMDVTIYQ